MMNYGNALYNVIVAKRKAIINHVKIKFKDVEKRTEQLVKIKNLDHKNIEKLYFEIFNTHKVNYNVNW